MVHDDSGCASARGMDGMTLGGREGWRREGWRGSVSDGARVGGGLCALGKGGRGGTRRRSFPRPSQGEEQTCLASPAGARGREIGSEREGAWVG